VASATTTSSTSSSSLLDRLRAVVQPSYGRALEASPQGVDAARVAAQASGASLEQTITGGAGAGGFLSDLAAGIRGGLDEAHRQEEFFTTLSTIAGVVFVAGVVLVLALLAAYFLAPLREAGASLLKAAT